MGRTTLSDEERFEEFIEIDGDHHIWTGRCSGGSNRPVFRVGGKLVYAHRYAWLVEHGEVPKHLAPDCGRRDCVNPYHQRELRGPIGLERLMQRVRREGECWVWTGGRIDDRPMVWTDGKFQSAHRTAYRLVIGELPGNLTRTCSTRLCINPHHYERVSR